MGYAIELFLHSEKLGRERCLLKYIVGPWSCVQCKYLNFWGKSVCNNCSHKWETKNGRLVEDNIDVLQHYTTPGYWEMFFENPWHVPEKSYAGELYFSMMFHKRQYLGR